MKPPHIGILEAAELYANKGWAVMPVHSITREGRCSCGRQACLSRGKHPRTQHGVKDAVTDLEIIRGWWRKWPNANVGIATGERSGLVVLDVDPRNGGTRSFLELQERFGRLPKTVQAITGGGGRHILFKYPSRELPIRNVAGLASLPGLDVKADGGYIVAPPSRHVSGGLYGWDPESHPDNLSVAELPGALLRLLTEPTSTAGRNAGMHENGQGLIPQGSRNHALTSIGGGLRRQGLEASEIEIALLSINERRCEPPLAGDEVARIAHSVARYPNVSSGDGNQTQEAGSLADLYARSMNRSEGSVPEVRIGNRQLRDVISDTWTAVHATNKGPEIFIRNGSLVRIRNPEGGPHIELLSRDSLYGHLARIATWWKDAKDGPVDRKPDEDVGRDMLVNPDPKLPRLEALIFAPTFDQEGTLVATPGYHSHPRLWFHRSEDLQIDEVPDSPTADQVRRARDLLLSELFIDFPFVASSDRAHSLASLLLPFVRRMVKGCTPVHLFEAPSPGSGKGLLADVVSIVAIGRACTPTTITRDEDETRKKITSLLSKGQPLILIDNVRNGLSSAQLSSALTAETWTDRELGYNRMLELPNRATWIVTANNPRLSLEIARRCVRVRIDPKRDRPWQRTGFKHDPLRDWVRENRGCLIHAILILVQAWIVAGRPPGKRILGSFESWSRVIGGILEYAGVPDFLDDTEEFYEAADAEGQEWRAFTAAWWEKHRGIWVCTSDLFELGMEKDLLSETLGEKSPQSQRIRLGKALSSLRDRQFGEYRVEAGQDLHNKTAKYRLVKTGGGASPSGTVEPETRTEPERSKRGGPQGEMRDVAG